MPLIMLTENIAVELDYVIFVQFRPKDQSKEAKLEIRLKKGEPRLLRGGLAEKAWKNWVPYHPKKP